MKSTQNNVSDPLRITQIPQQLAVDALKFPQILYMGDEEYRLVQTKDPTVVYITPSGVYYGECRLPDREKPSKYVVGTEHDSSGFRFIVYMVMTVNESTWLIPICKFNSSVDALRAMCSFNNVGSHESIYLKINEMIVRYVDDEITIGEFITSCLCEFGYRDDPRLQEVIQMQVTYENAYNQKIGKDLPLFLREELPSIARSRDNVLIKVYSEIYDLIIKYNYWKPNMFKEPTYSKCISEIIKIGYDFGIM